MAHVLCRKVCNICAYLRLNCIHGFLLIIFLVTIFLQTRWSWKWMFPK